MSKSISILRKISLVIMPRKIIYDRLPKNLSPSTKKGIGQITGALFITFCIVLGVAFIESILKDNNLYKSVNQSKNQVKTEFNTSNPTNNNNISQSINQKVSDRLIRDSQEKEVKNSECNYKFWLGVLICPLSDSKLLGQVQNIGVIAAAVLFFIDIFDRKKQLERQAWQLIDGAQGSETSGARKQAIDDLYRENADITGLDADGADLREINLSGANLTRASFKKAILEGANFEKAILEEANFTGAILKGANFSGANLVGAIFIGADFTELLKNKQYIRTKLRGADLGRAVLDKTDLYNVEFGLYQDQNTGKEKYTNLNGAKLRFANIKNVNLKGVSIAQAYFGGAMTGEHELNINIIRNAENFQKAYYGRNFCEAFSKIEPDIQLTVDEEYEKLQQTIHKDKIAEITQRIKNKILDYPNSKDVLDVSDLILLLDILEQAFDTLEKEKYCAIQARGLKDKTVNFKEQLEELSQIQEEFKNLIAETNEMDRRKQELDAKKSELDRRSRVIRENLKYSNDKNDIS